MDRRDKRLRALACTMGAAALAGLTGTAGATEYFNGTQGEIAARIAVQNSFQHDGTKRIDWVQERNELRFDIKYQLIKPGDSVGILNTANMNLLWRGRYDSVYDIRDAYDKRGYSEREDLRFPEGNRPRELFLDLGFNGALSPFSLRIGKQQVVWGESDLFRSIDVVNPLDISQNGFVGEDFADLREPLWIVKGLWAFGNVGKYLDEAGLETFYSPNSRPQADRPWIQYGETWVFHTNQHNILTGFERNVALPFHQVRAPWEFGRVATRYRDSPAVVQNADGTFSDFAYQINNNTPSSEFDVRDASMAGVRFMGTTVGNLYFTLNYLFKRADAAGSAVVFEDLFDPAQPGTGALKADVLNDALAAAGTPDNDGDGMPDGQEQQLRDCLDRKRHVLILDPAAVGNDQPFDGSIYSDPSNPKLHTGANNVSYKPVLPIAGDGLVHSTGCLTIPVWHPWTHIIGGTLTYNDYDYTGFVWRMEQSFSTKEPRNGPAPQSPDRLQLEKRGGVFGVPQERDFATHNMRTVQVWRSMIGFDYLRSILPGGKAPKGVPQPFRSLLTDQWFFTAQFLNEYYSNANHLNLQTSFTNRSQHFNPLLTFAATGFFVHQTFRPTLAVGYDVNQQFPLFIVQGEYFITPKLSLRLADLIYAGGMNQETFSGLHHYADRDTLFARLTYYFI
jgi:hypothetical protein